MIKCDMKPALLLALFSCTCVTSQANHDTNYFIETPANTTVAIITSSDSPLLWGDFSCATRLGSRPLWIVNGVSIDIITETAGYNGTYSEYFHLPHGDGNFLSFLSIPALPATNNSIVTCAAIASESSSNTIFAYSAPVHMLVVDALRDKNVTLITPIPSHPTSTSASMPGMDPTADLMNTSHRDRTTKLIASVSVVCGLIFIFTITLLFVIIFVVLQRNWNFKKHMSKGGNRTAQSNIYWNPKKENTPNVVNMNNDKQYLHCT